jgi:hypothetical protein
MMKTISQHDLERVTGGKTGTLPTGTDSGSGGNDQLMTAIQGIQSSIKDLAGNNKSNCPFGGPTGMMLMALALSRRSEVVVYGGRRGGYWYRSSW